MKRLLGLLVAILGLAVVAFTVVMLINGETSDATLGNLRRILGFSAGAIVVGFYWMTAKPTGGGFGNGCAFVALVIIGILAWMFFQPDPVKAEFEMREKQRRAGMEGQEQPDAEINRRLAEAKLEHARLQAAREKLDPRNSDAVADSNILSLWNSFHTTHVQVAFQLIYWKLQRPILLWRP